MKTRTIFSHKLINYDYKELLELRKIINEEIRLRNKIAKGMIPK